MSDDERKVKQLVQRIDNATLLLGKLHDELLAIKRSLEGVNPVGEVMQFFDKTWTARYGVPNSPSSASQGPLGYVWNRSVDPAHIKRILKVMDAATLTGRIARYFGDRDPFLVKNKHPFNLFISRLNTYASGSGASTDAVGFEADAAPVVGCTHVPTCRSDAEHTRKKMSELRQ